MSRLLLANIEPGTSDEEIQEFLEKYGFPPADEIEHADGDGTRPSVLLSFDELDVAALEMLQQRVHGMFWKKRELSAQILRERFA